MTARDTAALAAQVEALTAQVDRLVNVARAMELNADALKAAYWAGYAKAQSGMHPAAPAGRPGRAGRRGRARLSVVAQDGTSPGGAA